MHVQIVFKYVFMFIRSDQSQLKLELQLISFDFVMSRDERSICLSWQSLCDFSGSRTRAAAAVRAAGTPSRRRRAPTRASSTTRGRRSGTAPTTTSATTSGWWKLMQNWANIFIHNWPFSRHFFTATLKPIWNWSLILKLNNTQSWIPRSGPSGGGGGNHHSNTYLTKGGRRPSYDDDFWIGWSDRVASSHQHCY